MPTRPKLVQARSTSLKGSISSTESSNIKLRNLLDLYGNALAMSDFGNQGYLTIDPGQATEEVVKFTGFTVNSDGTVDIDTGISRGMKGKTDYTSGSDASSHDNGAMVVVSNSPQVYEDILDYIDAISISGASSASETAEGIVELATTAELEAGTSTGSTGSRLVIPADNFNSSKYETQLPSSKQKTFLDGVVGMILPYGGASAPSGFALCDGSLLNNDDETDLHDVVVDYYGADAGTTFTADDSTDVVTANSHGLSNGNRISVSTDGTLPGGLSANTVYFVIEATTNTFKVSTTSGGSAVDITSTGSGTHKFHAQFKVPDLRGRFPLGKDNMGSSSADRVTNAQADTLGGSEGAETHTLTIAEMPSHQHDADTYQAAGSEDRLSQGDSAGGSDTLANAVKATGGGGAHNNMSPYLTLNYIIKK